MGRKSGIKKERNAIKKCNITVHSLLENAKEYQVQEYHPKNTQPMTYEIFQEMRVMGIAPVEEIENLLSKLVYKYPSRRFAIAVEEGYKVGEHDIPIFSYPPMQPEEIREFEEGIR
jgi:hypothetical protein